MKLAHSADGTAIAYDTVGAGPPMILVDGALCSRSFGPMPKLATRLAGDFTVLHYDRRGRGESGDGAPYSVEREVEDLEAIVHEAGGSAQVCALSSGAALALETAKRCEGITKLAVYEAPWILDDAHAPLPREFLPRLQRLVAQDRRLKAVAHTLPNDIAMIAPHEQGLPLAPGELADITAPTLVLVGGKSPGWMRNAMHELAGALPRAQHRVLDGQTHNVKLKVLAPVITEFFLSAPATPELDVPGTGVRV